MKKVNLTYIIDDDNIFVFVLKKIMEKNENFAEVLDFKNGDEVINILSDENNTLPNIILLDINMPVVDGWEFLGKIEKLPNKEKLNIFIMSSSIDVNDIKKSKSFSTVKDFISKPINNDKLNKLIESI